MVRANAYKRVLRALGAGVLAVFAFGSTSGPLRTCLNHPSHASGEHGAEHSATSHAVDHATAYAGHEPPPPVDHGPASDHEGCSCLGLCSLENAPGLPGERGPSLVAAPNAPKAIAADVVNDFRRHDAFNVPLARPPPAVA